MVLSRRFLRFLRTAVLAAVLALGLAGTALAASVWKGQMDDITRGKWEDGNCWNPTGVPGTNIDEIVEIPQGSVVTVENASTIDNPLKEVVFKGDATLTLKDAAHAMTVKKITVEAGKKATVNAEGDDDKFVVTDTNSIFNVGDDAVLTLKGNTVKGVGELQLLGKGTLVLKAPVTSATDLEITEGGTLDVDVANALPAVAAPVTITKGNLTLNRGLADTAWIYNLNATVGGERR